MTITKKIVLTFPQSLVDKPIVFHLIKDYNLVFNILRASITPKEEGLMVIEISGKEDDFKKGADYLKKQGVNVQPLKKDVKWVEKKCIQCGACIPICPTNALKIDRDSMKISFDEEKCIACELCVRPCPARAFEVRLY